MKKKVMAVVVIGLILLFPVIRNAFNEFMTPDKVLSIGQQVSDDVFVFTKEIKGKEKIVEFENLFDQVNFLSNEWNEETYPDIIVQINHKKGYFTHVFHIWINGEEGIALMPALEEKKIGRLSSLQLEKLKEIIN